TMALASNSSCFHAVKHLYAPRSSGYLGTIGLILDHDRIMQARDHTGAFVAESCESFSTCYRARAAAARLSSIAMRPSSCVDRGGCIVRCSGIRPWRGIIV